MPRTPVASLASLFATSCATLFAVACVSIAVTDKASAAESDVRRPNVVLMMADDMGVGDTSAYQDLTGNSDRTQIDTPSMSRLARLGVRFSDAHSSSTRCTNTRYGLLTGRYPWRSRMKHWVLFGAQGDPMIEADRPTLATLFGASGYRTAMVGKWHVGLRYRRGDGSPAAGFDDADLTKPLFDGPLDHGFDVARITSRSHGTSGTRPRTDRNRPDQTVGPGHIDGRLILSATGDGRRLVDDGPDAYVLEQLGGRHSDNAVEFMESHLAAPDTRDRPFFLYYASNSNHTPYTPDDEIDGVAVAGAGKNVAGDLLGERADFVYENDVAVGRLIRFLETHDDPRHVGQKLIENTIVIFTSDNGAEIQDAAATGPHRSNKGSAYEGGHRVPFLVAWPAGGVGDGDETTPGVTRDEAFGLHDLYATFAEVTRQPLPDFRAGERGAEDSVSLLDSWRGSSIPPRPQFHHDHKQADDPAASAIRVDDPDVGGQTVRGRWKLFFDAALLRRGEAHPTELYELRDDPAESRDRLGDASLRPLVDHLTELATLHRVAGGHRLAAAASGRPRVSFDWRADSDRVDGDLHQVGLAQRHAGRPASGGTATAELGGGETLTLMIRGLAAPTNEKNAANEANAANETGTANAAGPSLAINPRGLGVTGGRYDQVESGEAIEITFDRDVLVESAALVAGNGSCGGSCRIADRAPLQIYCIDADNDQRDQSGVMSDLGVVRAGEVIRFDSAPHLGVEPPGQWRLGAITVRPLATDAE